MESHENLDQIDRDLVSLEQEPNNRDLISRIFRAIHTIKGTSGFLAFTRLETLAHAGESLLSRLRDGVQPVTPETITTLLATIDGVRSLLAAIEQTGAEGDVDVDSIISSVHAQMQVESAPAAAPAAAEAEPNEALQAQAAPKRSVADSAIRVDVDLLDNLMNMVGELVLARNQLVRGVMEIGDATLVRSAQRLGMITSELQEGIMKTRMQPIEHIWSKLPRVVRDLSNSLGKQVQLVMEGKETELDRSLLEAVKA